MMQAKITQAVVQNVATTEKRLTVYDTLLKGLVLFVRPTGKRHGLSITESPTAKEQIILSVPLPFLPL
jgi:hypothetical protein